MFQKVQLEHAVEMQQRSYFLLRWLAEAVKSETIRLSSAHTLATFREAASVWLTEHRLILPKDAQPAEKDLSAFTNFFCTYLENTLDLALTARRRPPQLQPNPLPVGYCPCPLCTWLVDDQYLKPKKLATADKNLADRMREVAIRHLASELTLSVSDAQIDRLLADETGLENASLVAYGLDLFERLEGISNGPAVLALWRGFAWTRSGSPKKSFRLSADRIIEAESYIVEWLRRGQNTRMEPDMSTRPRGVSDGL